MKNTACYKPGKPTRGNVHGTFFTLGTDSQLTSDGSGHWKLTTTTTFADGTYSAFVHTAENGSFSAAARILGLTPAGVSKNVATLEADLTILLDELQARGLVSSSGSGG